MDSSALAAVFLAGEACAVKFEDAGTELKGSGLVHSGVGASETDQAEESISEFVCPTHHECSRVLRFVHAHAVGCSHKTLTIQIVASSLVSEKRSVCQQPLNSLLVSQKTKPRTQKPKAKTLRKP